MHMCSASWKRPSLTRAPARLSARSHLLHSRQHVFAAAPPASPPSPRTPSGSALQTQRCYECLRGCSRGPQPSNNCSFPRRCGPAKRRTCQIVLHIFNLGAQGGHALVGIHPDAFKKAPILLGSHSHLKHTTAFLLLTCNRMKLKHTPAATQSRGNTES
jgi:hypothetical protein